MNSIDGIDIAKLAEQYGTPLYVYSSEQIKRNYHNLNTSFQKYYPKTKIHYSVKANSNLNILKLIKSIGCGVDCSSPYELELSKRVGYSSEKILYTGNYESLDDLQHAINSKVSINLDDINSFKRLIKIEIPDRIAFRINPGIGRGGFEGIITGGTDAKFGIPYEKAYEAYKLAKDSGIHRFGIHMMTGSNNLEPYYFAEIVDKLMTIASDIFHRLDITPEYVDIGGGFGVPYDNDEDPLNVDLTAQLVSEMFVEKCAKHGFGAPYLYLEPGRFIVANSGYLISQITGIKNSYKKFIGIDAGMNTLIRPALYGAKHRIEIYKKEINTQVVNICGQICENSDIFSVLQPFPEVSEGDFAIIRDVGAYGYVMSSNYNNRPRPAEVLIDQGNHFLIRRRENYDDFLRLYEF